MKKQKNHCKYFEGIGDSEYETDFFLHEIPIITDKDSAELKRKKRLYIKRKLASLRSSLAR